MLRQNFYQELQDKERETGLALLVDNVSWHINDPDRDMDPLPASLSAEQRQAIEEVLAAHNPNSAANLLIDVHRNRVKAYPPIGDQLDAIWKGGEAAVAMKAQVMAVKAKYPKP